MLDKSKHYDTPARYRVLERSFLADTENPTGRLVEAGEEIDYSGHPGMALQPLDAEGRKRRAYYLQMKGTTEGRARHHRDVLAKGAADEDGALGRSSADIARDAEAMRVGGAKPVPIPRGKEGSDGDPVPVVDDAAQVKSDAVRDLPPVPAPRDPLEPRTGSGPVMPGHVTPSLKPGEV